MLLEVCVDNFESAINACAGGAGRLELCAALSEGGLSPSLGLFIGIKKALSNKIPIFVMIRIRRGDFNYSSNELQCMLEEVKLFKEAGADGIVFGCLKENHDIDFEKCSALAFAWGGGPMTFHRAFDLTFKDQAEENIQLLSEMGFTRILSSGFEATAAKGTENLRNLVDIGIKWGVTVMPGAGVNGENIDYIVKNTGCIEFHGSARSAKTSIQSKLSMGGGVEDLQPLLVCDQNKVQELLKNCHLI
ncbi:unnamed protein product [Diamesa tonsa]